MTGPIQLDPIGIVRTPYINKYDAPRQPRIDARVDEAYVELYPHRNYDQALRDVEGCDRIWLITYFDRAVGWKPLILTPRDRTKRGVFATRSPHRPNPIGLTCVELVSVKGLKVVVKGTDLLDRTPVLDIKPYLAYSDAYPQSQVHWVEQLHQRPTYHVVWSDKGLALPNDVREHAERVLSADPFPHPYRRIERRSDGDYTIAVREYRISFRVTEDTVIIL